MELVKYPNDILTTKTKDIIDFDSKLENIVAEMADIMYKSNGAGIAANQVGLAMNIFIIDNSWKGDPDNITDKNLQVFINPVILETYGDIVYWTEGCLSFGKIRPDVPRYKKIKVKYQDLKGNIIEEILEGERLDMVHRFQHEYDHVIGKIFLDNISREEQLRMLGEEGMNLSKTQIEKCMNRFDKIRK